MIGLLSLVHLLVRPRGRKVFIASLPRQARVFDVGCGPHGPATVKQLRPDVTYVGIDIVPHQDVAGFPALCDEFILAEPEAFHREMARFTDRFDAVISSHNLEHCNDPDGVLVAMIRSLKPGGVLYLAFPCAASVRFPPRRGTLNFHDDPTHRNVIPFAELCTCLTSNGMEIRYAARRYRPLLPFLLGLALEPFVRPCRRQAPFGGTWALYGFETVIHARKAPR